MKLKVTYKLDEKRSVSTVIDINADSISDMLKDILFNEIYEKTGARKKEAVKYGYISKIEDLDQSHTDMKKNIITFLTYLFWAVAFVAFVLLFCEPTTNI